MCGIAGILSTTLDKHCISSTLEVMQNALHHRGPNGHGDYLSPSGQAGLAHTRLSIIDLSEKASQPMTDSTERFVISFNGEIYNYLELRAELQEQGYQFNSHSDTEVILALYQKLGQQCVHKLRGMFAFIIWDEEEKIAFAARDPFGIKPFYYWHDEQSFALASEIKSILSAQLSNKKLDPQGMYDFLKTGSTSEPNTLVSDIKLLPAGHCLTWQKGYVETQTYWRINFSQQQTAMTYDEAVRHTRLALENSIKAHLVSDVPIGVFLSGGIDSTAIVALASQYSEKQINTYSIAFENPDWNEGDIAQQVAKHFGTRHTELVMTKELAKPLFKEYLNAIDQPSIDGFNTFCVAKLAHDNGEKVILSGLGGDEVFAGYKSFELLPKMLRISRSLSLLSPWIKFKQKRLNRLLSAKFRRIFDFLGQPNSLVASQQSLRGIFSHQEAAQLCQQLSCAQEHYTQTKEPAHQHLKDKISDIELSTYLRNQLLRDSDVMTMHWGLELRVPLIDSVMFDSISTIPADMRLLQGKKLLIDAVPEIPQWVSSLPKRGFRFPFDDWFSDNWEQANIKPPSWIKLTPWYRKWSLTVLSNWIERHEK